MRIGSDLLLADVADDAAHSVTDSFDAFESVSSASIRLSSFFFFSTQPSLLSCLPALTASAPAGTSSVTVVPAATYAPLPTVTGAISCESLPMNAPSSMMV